MNTASTWIAQAAAALVAGMLLLSVAGPLATDDLWWHLGLGHAYAAAGLPLNADPHLHTALEAPPANAWLFDRALATLDTHFGLQALRGLHIALVAMILGGVARLLYKRSGSSAYAALGTLLFISCAAYRLAQLRPDLMTLLGTVLLALLLFAHPGTPSWRNGALVVALCALWSNLHPGFLLGPALIAGAALGAAVGAFVGPLAERAADRARAIRLAWIFVAGLLATSLNPDGLGALLRYSEAGLDSAGQAMVVDEWRAFSPFTKPLMTLPPAPLAFAVTWLSLVATPIAIAGTLITRTRAQKTATDETFLPPRGDLALAALAGAGLVAPFVAIRFLWLILFPLLLGADLWHRGWTQPGSENAQGARARSRMLLAVAVSSLALVPLYSYYAERNTAPRSFASARARDAFDSDRYFAHSVWFLADSQAEGRLFHPYFMGGFLDYWLAPRCRTFIDGSLNVPPGVLEDYGRVQRAGREIPIATLESILDAYDIDFYIGVGLPMQPVPGRPWRYTTTDLERSQSWMLVFRNLRSAVYMRRHPRNDENLARIASLYAQAGVPFSTEAGLDVAALLERAPSWAIRNGAAPHDFPHLKRAADAPGPRISPGLRAIARDRLATTYAVLGLCDAAIELDEYDERSSISHSPAAPSPVREQTRKRRLASCRAAKAESASPRTVWLTSREAGRIKGTQRRAATRTRPRTTSVPYSGSQ